MIRMPKKKDPQVSDVSEEQRISIEIQRLSKVLALTAVKNLQQNEQISFLDAVGYPPIEIAEMVRTTPGTVSQTLYSMRKGKKQKKKAAKN